MKIIQLVFNLCSGGAEKFAMELSNELSKNHDVYLCVIQNDLDMKLSFFKDRVSKSVHYINLGCNRGLNLKSFFTIFELIRNIRPNVVHAHLNTKLYLFLPSLIFKNKIKFVHTLHSLAEFDVGFGWQKRINNFFYKKKIINAVSISNECKDSFVKFYRHHNVSMIENGVPYSYSTPAFEKVKDEIIKYKQNETDIVIIHVARYSQEKNQELLVNVFNRLKNKNVKAILLVIGPNYDNPQARILIEESNRDIHYLGLKSNVSDYLLNSNIFVLSSLWEGLPMSLLEALSCGVFPVCTPAGGIKDVLKNENIGYLSKDFSEDSFYLTLKKCIDNFNEFDKEKLIEYFKTNYSIERCAANYLRIY